MRSLMQAAAVTNTGLVPSDGPRRSSGEVLSVGLFLAVARVVLNPPEDAERPIPEVSFRVLDPSTSSFP